MTLAGVSFGAHSPNHGEERKPGRPASSPSEFPAPSGAGLSHRVSGLTLPACTCDRKFDDGSIMKSICPATRSCAAGPLPR